MFIVIVVDALRSKTPLLLAVQLQHGGCHGELDFKASFLCVAAAWYQDSG